MRLPITLMLLLCVAIGCESTRERAVTESNEALLRALRNSRSDLRVERVTFSETPPVIRTTTQVTPTEEETQEDEPEPIEYAEMSSDRGGEQTAQLPPGVYDPRLRPLSPSGGGYQVPRVGPTLVPVSPIGPGGGPYPGMRPVPQPSLLPPILEVESKGERVTLTVRNALLNDVLTLLVEQQGLNLVTAEVLDARVTANLEDVMLDEALHSLLSVSGFTWMRQGRVLLITRVAPQTNVPPHAQGRQVRVFTLSYASALELQETIRALLSPVGKVFATPSDPEDVRRTKDRVVVEDLPEYLHRIETVVAQFDVPPRQVLIEAHVLQVNLNETNRHGVNLREIANLAGTQVTFNTTGFANPNASPSMLVGVQGGDLSGLIEALQSTTDSKTLATPRVLVVDGQEARIQIGSRLGYFVSTFNDNQTIQSVNFLDVGVVLQVTPHITEDGHILMSVRPEVSNGVVDQAGLPQEDTTEVETSVLLPDGQGIVIGGLLQETDTDTEARVAGLGNLFLVGGLFKRENVVRDRTELIVALVPRLVPYAPDFIQQDRTRFQRATTRLLHGPLVPMPRPWEPKLPSSSDRPDWLENSSECCEFE